jgi:hypothetical protein
MKKEVNGKLMKRFVLTVYDEGQLEDVIEGLSVINGFITPLMKNPPLEAPYEEEEGDMYIDNEEYD